MPGKTSRGDLTASCAAPPSSDIRLYLPERCDKAGIPEDHRQFLTQPQIALHSIRHQRRLGIGFERVSMDSGYGSEHPFLHALDRDGESFVAEVHCDQRVWTEAPHQQGVRPGKPLWPDEHLPK
jgi:SRSO17 transposase